MTDSNDVHLADDRTTGGIPALRGFRKQFLHTLHRIIVSKDEVIYPESLEDFAVYNNSGALIEVVQIKDHSAPLTFSELNTFFQRAIQISKSHPNTKIILASYGKLGPELEKHIGADEAILKKNKKFNSPDMLTVFQRLTYKPLKEKAELNAIKKFLSKNPMASGDWQTAFDILMQDLYRGAEKGKSYSRDSLQEYLQQIGKYLIEREAHHKEWGVTIIPLIHQEIIQRKQLHEAFYEGVAASWAHILANIDVVRDQHLKAIADGFQKNSIVIVHGASGQGKSALAYRYLHDYCPSASRYEIRELSTSKRALEVASALAGYNVPLTFYIDASHKDKGLPEFLRRIRELHHVSCLVTIREEDWRLTGLTSADIQFTDLELSFNREDAQELYITWERDRGSHFPDFEQAWTKFSEEGPLLEFVHLLTHTESLQDRLQKQYERIVDEIDCQQRPENDLKLMEYVAVAGACGARIDLTKLSGTSSLTRSISRLENEYLLRLSKDERYLTGLHPIRSKILSSIISDPIIHPWSSLAIECLPIIEDEDIEIFLLHSFVSHPEASEPILEYLNSATYDNWTKVAGVSRALLWKGIHEYMHINKKLLERVYDKVGDGWLPILDFDYLGLLDAHSNNSGFLDLLPEHGRKQAEEWRKHQTPKAHVFARIDYWLQNLTLPPIPLFDQEKAWQEFGQVAYWIGFRKLDKQLSEYLDWDALRQTVEKLPLKKLTNLIYGLWHALSDTEPFEQWYREIRPTLKDRYRIETCTPYLEEQDSVIRAHFIIPLEINENKESESINQEKSHFHQLARHHVELLAQLFPDCTGYGCQGYGHQVFDFEVHDDTTKNKIAAWTLTPNWVIQINMMARIIASHFFRPKTWQDYSSEIFQIRTDLNICFGELRKFLSKHFRSKKPVQQLSELPKTPHWRHCSEKINKIPKIPLEALDSWGYTEEPQEKNQNINKSGNKEKLIISGYLKRYQAYLNIKNNFFTGLSNFLYQSPHLIEAHAFLGKPNTPQERFRIEQTNKESNLNLDRPFLPGYNLAEALKALTEFQLLYRKHFSGLLDKELLSQLEQEESKTLRELWCLWFFFTTQPKRRIDMPVKFSQAQLERKMQANLKAIEKALAKASTDELQFRCLGDDLQFENKPALWLIVDGENPLETFAQIELLFEILKKALGEITLHSLEYYTIEFQWQNIIIIPLCKGKLIEALSWVIPIYRFTTNLTSNEGLSNLNLVPRQIDRNTLNRLGLIFWEPALLKDARVFFQCAANLQIHLRHLIRIGNLPDMDESGAQITQAYFDQLQEDLSENFQKLKNQAAILFSLNMKITEMNQEESSIEYLQLAITHLREISEKLIPNKFENGQVIFTIETIREWQKEMASIEGEIFIIYLFWCGYLIS